MKKTVKEQGLREPPAQRHRSNNPLEGADSELQRMLEFLKTRGERNGPSLSEDINDFLKTHLPKCFAHLDAGKRSKIGYIMRSLIPLSHTILSAEKGLEAFEWTVKKAAAIASKGKPEEFCPKLTALFNATAKVVKLAKREDRNRFISAFEGLPEDKAIQMVQRIYRAENNVQIKHAITMGYSQAQKRLSSPPATFKF